jgi:hypothetical protein
MIQNINILILVKICGIILSDIMIFAQL